MLDHLYAEMQQLPRLENAGIALVRYAIAISTSEPVWEKEQWVFRPENFMTLRIQPRDRSIKFSFRGHPSEFLLIDGVDLNEGMGNGSYSTCKFSDPSELASIAMHIRTAFDNYRRGAKRIRRKPQLHTAVRVN